jgi:hypothetical protein
MRWLENERYQRALWANAQERPAEKRNLQTFLEEEWFTQCVLDRVGITPETPISKIPKIDKLDYIQKWVDELPYDFVIEVAGMPMAGKETVINGGLESLWPRGTRNQIYYAGESARKMPEKYQRYKQEDPFLFTSLTETEFFLSSYKRIIDSASGQALEVPVLSKRGVTDRIAFRRALFFEGEVNPWFMDNEWFWEYGFAPPYRTGAVILCLVKPETSLEREEKELGYPREKPGPVMNINFLNLLFEQYLRLHYELPQRIYHHQLTRGPLPIYIALNMEESKEECFEKFNRTMFQVFNLAGHKI